MKYDKITISGNICTGKTTLFWDLQQHLIWPVFSTSHFFRDYSRTNRMILETADEQNKKLTTKVDNRVGEMLKMPGNLIVEGWMAGIMADKLPRVLRILLTCNDDIRVKRFSFRERVTLKVAKERILEREKNLFDKLGHIYKRNDFLDPKNYNLLVDTSNLTLAKVFSRVATFL